MELKFTENTKPWAKAYILAAIFLLIMKAVEIILDLLTNNLLLFAILYIPIVSVVWFFLLKRIIKAQQDKIDNENEK